MSAAPVSALAINVPALDIDVRLAKLRGYTDGKEHVSQRGRVERRVVAGLIAHMVERGFRIVEVHDLEEATAIHGETDFERAKNAMEVVFNLDEVNLHFAKVEGGMVVASHHDAFGPRIQMHCACLVLGNGTDIVSDWFIDRLGDGGFNKAMEAFDASAFA